jgi:hypothetical protein
MAMATEQLRVGTFVLNAGFYRPALLARDAAGDRFDELELNLSVIAELR